MTFWHAPDLSTDEEPCQTYHDIRGYGGEEVPVAGVYDSSSELQRGWSSGSQ